MTAETLDIWLNGEVRAIAPELPLLSLLQDLQLNPRLLAIEYNGEILPRKQWGETILQAGDRLELVTMVGGG